MALIPDSLRVTAEQLALDRICARAKERHEKARKAAAARGRKDFPALPYECSWAFQTKWLEGYNEEGRRPFRPEFN